MQNIKRMFFVLALVMLLATVGAVHTADDADSTIATDTSVSGVATVSNTAGNNVGVKPVQTTSNDNKVDTKTIEKEDKQIKSDKSCVEVSVSK